MIPLETWLKTFGFDRNPFESTEAGSEDHYVAQFLHDTFVKPECFDRVLGNASYPKSTLVFAPRGSGKSSTRVMLAHFCREGLIPLGEGQLAGEQKYARVLPVLHSQFQEIQNVDPSRIVDEHVTEILGRATLEFAKAVATNPEIAERASRMSILRRLELQSCLLLFSSYLPFDLFKAARQYLGNELIKTNDQKRPIGFVSPPLPQDIDGLTAAEIDILLMSRTSTIPSDLLSRLADLISDSGFGAIYVLIDGLDETWGTANDYKAAANLIAPLLADLNLMNNTPKLAFKLFAPLEVKQYLLEASQRVRRDRLMVDEIHWNENTLTELLRRRLASCSKETVFSLDATSVPEIRGRIDLDLINQAGGIPRRLILLGDSALRIRCEAALPDDSETYLLTETDLDKAAAYVKKEYPALQPVQIQLEEPAKAEILTVVEDEREDWPRHELPAPLARAYLLYSRERLAHIRIWKLYELVEASTAYLSLALIALLWQQLGEQCGERLRRSGLRLERTSLGGWRIALQTLPGMCAGLGIQDSLVKNSHRLANQHAKFINTVTDERNKSAHSGPQTEEYCTTVVEMLNDPLHNFLKELHFLTQMYLVKVCEMGKQGNEFVHHCIWYKGDVTVYPSLNLILTIPLDSGPLWLVRDSRPLNVSPLILAETASDGFGEDIWLYQNVNNDEVIYKNYGTGRTITNREHRDLTRKLLGV